MKLAKYFIQGFIVVLCIGNIFGQSELPLGTWKSHLAYNVGLNVTQSKDKVIYSSSSGIFTVDKEDLSIDFLAKEEGLTDVRVASLHYNKSSEHLVIIYNNNNIDIIKDDQIVNIPFIETNTSIIGSKSVNDVFFSDNIAYLAADFGVLGFDLDALEFTFTTFTPFRINSVAVHDDQLFAGTEKGLYNINLKGTNISDFGVWTKVPESDGISNLANITSLAVKYDRLYTEVNDKVLVLGIDKKFTTIFATSSPEDEIKFLSDDGTTLMIGIAKGNDGRLVFMEESGQIIEGTKTCVRLLRNAIEDEKGRIWYADQWAPIKYTSNKTANECLNIDIPAPYANDASSIRFKKDKAYFGSNGVNEDFQYGFTLYGYYSLQDGKWENFSPENFPPLRDFEFFHTKAVAPHPTKSDVYLGSYYNGIIRYNEDTKEVKHWNKDNSILQRVVGDEARTRIAGLTFDDDENLWISNYGAQKPLVVKTKEDTWHNFNVPGSTNLHQIVIDQQGNKWIVVFGVGNGILVYNEGTDIPDPTDDKIRLISRNNSEITGNRVNCAAVDLDGSIWIGTDQGPVVFDCGDPFAETCRGTTRKVVVDDIPAPLLRYEDILSIAVDGANRKWFGTRNGIFVQSPDGVTQVDKFDVKNSPLLDNLVKEMAYNPATGEMFIVSREGIQSYKTMTSGGVRSHNENNVYAYPNPVRPDYIGPISIKGLVRDANVKITDINGKLIFETKALGGQAIWDGKDYNGNDAATGVYLVFSANENTSLSPDSLVTKILIVH
jgi:sugar lactone lactonase YvrE